MKQLYSQHLPKGFNYPPSNHPIISKETYHLDGNINPHSFYYQSNIQTESIMSKEEIDRILNTDFTEIDHTIEEKINSIDEMTGKLNERSGFLAQFQLMLQSELGNIKNTGKMASKSKEESEASAIITKEVEIPKVEEEKTSTRFQISKYNQQPYEPKAKQRVVAHEKPTISVGMNTLQRSFAMQRVVNIVIENVYAQKLKNKQKEQHLRGKLDAAKIELEEFKLLIAFLKEEIKVEIEYFKEKIALETSQTCKNLQSHLQSQHQIEVSCLETQLSNLKTQILKISQENRVLLLEKNPLKQLTFHKNTEEKMNSLNVTRRLKEVQYYPSQYNSPDRHKISPNQIINSDQWKTYRLRFDQNEIKKTERLQFKQKQAPKDPYMIPSVKTITVGIPPIKNGFGILKSGNQIIYRGMWKDGKFDGSGKLNWEGYCYEGNFSNGAFQGHGSLHIKDILFVGKFKSNKACGEGTLQIDKKKIVGVWENNHLIRIF